MGLFGLFACKTSYQPLETVASVDLQKYCGRWYEIASFPQIFQKGCSCTYAEYTLTEKGVKVYNNCYQASKNKRKGITGKAFVVKNSGNAKLKVQFFWPFKGDYWIIELADDYSYAAVGAPDREYLWILAREKSMDESTYAALLAKITAKDFDVSRLVKTTHNCND